MCRLAAFTALILWREAPEFVIARPQRGRGNLGKALPSRTGRRFVVPAIVGEGHAPPGTAQTIRTGCR